MKHKRGGSTDVEQVLPDVGQVLPKLPIMNHGVNPGTKGKDQRINVRKIYTINDLETTSIEFIIHDIRFNLFQQVTTSQKKELFMDLIKTPVKNLEIKEEFIKLLNKNDFNSLVNFVKENVLPEETLEKIIKGSNPRFRHDFNKIFDIYFTIEKPEIAIGVLRYLIFLESENQEAHNNFLQTVTSYDEIKLEILSKSICWNSEII